MEVTSQVVVRHSLGRAEADRKAMIRAMTKGKLFGEPIGVGSIFYGGCSMQPFSWG